MRIYNEPLLQTFRTDGRCELCHKWQGRRQAHHLWGKGFGGAFHLDHEWNLMSLCLKCHNKFHDGNVDKQILIGIVAKRVGTTADNLRWTIIRMRNK